MLALFAGHSSISARYWLLDSPNGPDELGSSNPDGAGIGWFEEEGAPHLDRAPVAALDDPGLACDARTLRSGSLVAHVRRSTGTARSLDNTQPFEREGRLFAHNGALGGLADVEELAGPWADHFAGDTDSERFFALVSRRADECHDLSQGLIRAVTEIASLVPVSSLNCVIATRDELLALRYPATDTLWWLERAAGPGIRSTGRDGSMRVEGDAARVPHVVVASEPLDDDPRWHSLAPGELLRVDARMRIRRGVALSGVPAEQEELRESWSADSGTLVSASPRGPSPSASGRRSAVPPWDPRRPLLDAGSAPCPRPHETCLRASQERAPRHPPA
ncbi:class II glutamine amidotransferase [Motilibacter rhizosphaerae]|nr:class II glutamine amidotransferase [Motilibacter rhizosphaerae]